MSDMPLTPTERTALEVVRDHPRIASATLAKYLWPHRYDERGFVTHDGRSARPEFGLNRAAGKVQAGLARKGYLRFPGWMGEERGSTYLITPEGLDALGVCRACWGTGSIPDGMEDGQSCTECGGS